MWITLATFIFVYFVPIPAYSGEAVFPHADPRRAQTALRSAVRSLGLQTQLPTVDKEIATRYSFWDKIFDYLNKMNISTQNAATVLFCVSLAVIAFVVFKTWRDNLWSSSRAHRLRRSAEESAHFAESAMRMERTQIEADDLAARGNFAEAMHVLLLRSVDELRRYLSVSIAASLTSREILRHISLPQEGSFAFADIIDRVEISYFGAHHPCADDYKACRSSFDALTGVLRRYSTQSGFSFASS